MQFMEAAVQLLNPDHFFRDRRSDPDRLAKKGFCKYQTEKKSKHKMERSDRKFPIIPRSRSQKK